MPEPGMEKTMEEILAKVQREYAEQAKQEARFNTNVGARDASHDNLIQSSEALSTWEKVTPNEIEQARQRVAREREAVLTRHEAELKQLDTQQNEINQMERLIMAFAHKHGAAGQLGS
jgi:hypothetical protein